MIGIVNADKTLYGMPKTPKSYPKCIFDGEFVGHTYINIKDKSQKTVLDRKSFVSLPPIKFFEICNR